MFFVKKEIFMPKVKKPVYIKCPRCELNYIKKSDKYCNVCKKEMKLIKPEFEDDITDLELCPICKTNFIHGNEDMCASCQEDQGLSGKNAFIDDDNWTKYIDEDDTEESEDISDYTIEEDDDLLPDAGIGLSFDDEMTKGLVELGLDDTDESEEELDDLDLDLDLDLDDDDDDIDDDDE